MARTTLTISFTVTLAFLAAFANAQQPQVCGPIVVAGHDADDHGFHTVYASIFDEILRNVQNGQTGILAIGADPGSTAGTWIQTVSSIMVTPQVVTFANDGAIGSIDFSTFAILHVPSDNGDTDGGINQGEAVMFNNRSADVAAFVGAGGGLFGLTQGQFVNGWSYITDVAPLEHLDVPPTGSLPSGNSFDNITATPEGLSLGITDTNLDGCCFHNVFTVYPSYLRPLAWADEATDPAYYRQAVFIGGLSTCLIVEPPLAVTFDILTAERSGHDVVVKWSTLTEEGTTGFVVHRADSDSATGVAATDFVSAHGPGRVYEAVDTAPGSRRACYYVQEYTVDGAGDRSDAVCLSAEGSRRDSHRLR